MENNYSDELVEWIESQPELDYLRVYANRTLCSYYTEEKSPRERIIVNSRKNLSLGDNSFLDNFKETFWVPGAKLRGNQFSTKELDNSLTTTAKVMSVSTLWDFFCTLPILFYAVGSAKLLAGPFTFIIGYLILWASNLTGENATNRTKGHSGKAKASLLAFIILSLAKTAVSGVGLDMILSKDQIINNFADELIESKSIGEESLINDLRSPLAEPAIKRELDLVRAECNSLVSQMKNLDMGKRSNRKIFEQLNSQARGNSQSPCNKSIELSSRLSDEQSRINSIERINKDKSSKRLNDRQELPPIDFLWKYYNNEYTTYFKGLPSGSRLINKNSGNVISENDTNISTVDWRDGRKSEAVSQASKQFFNKLGNGEIASLGLSLFGFIISVVLSSTAAILLYSTGKVKEVKASFTSSLSSKSNKIMAMYQKSADQYEVD